MDMWVRIKPHTVISHKTKRFSYDGVLFNIDKGWKRVTERTARELSAKVDRLGRTIFDVVDRDDAMDMDRAEVQAKRNAPTPETSVSLGRTDAPDAGDLPIPNYDKLSAKLIGRIVEKGKLTDMQLAELMQYEDAHDKRAVVKRLLTKATKAERADVKAKAAKAKAKAARAAKAAKAAKAAAEETQPEVDTE